jgi:hypothetical protein
MKFFKNKWSKWQDLSLTYFPHNYYLIQFRRHENGKLEFRVETTKAFFGLDTKIQLENLKQNNE